MNVPRREAARLPAAIDLTTAACFRDPRALAATFAQLRRERPVAWHPHADGGFWAVTRYADVALAASDRDVFEDADTHLIGGPGDVHPTAGAEAIAFRAGVAPFAPDRTPAQARLGQEAVAGLAPGVRARIAERLAAHAGAVDFVDLVAPLPAEVRATLAGVPGAQQDRVVAWVDTLGGRCNDTPSGESRRRAATEFFEYAEELLSRKRERPGDDLISDWLADSECRGSVTSRQIGVFLYTFIAIGSATTRNVAAAGQRLLFDAPELAARLRAHPSQLPAAVDEMLRLAPPFHYLRRTARRDAVLGGQHIAKGEPLALWLGAANRDPARFETPDRFDPASPRAPHLAFAGGGFFALGAALARVELVALFAELLQRFPEMLPAGPTLRADSNHENRTLRLPVHLGTAA